MDHFESWTRPQEKILDAFELTAGSVLQNKAQTHTPNKKKHPCLDSAVTERKREPIYTNGLELN